MVTVWDVLICCCLVICVQILSNFGMDVMEALSGTCTLWVAGRRSTSQLLADTLVAIGLTVTHSVTLMCEVSCDIDRQCINVNACSLLFPDTSPLICVCA